MRTRTIDEIGAAGRETLGRQVGAVARSFTQSLAERLPDGTTPTQAVLLTRMADRAGASQRELASATGIDTATLADLLRRLEARGDVRREKDPVDRRRTLVHLGETSADRLEAVRAAVREVNTLALAGFTAEEVATLSDLLGRLHTNLHADGGEGEVDDEGGGPAPDR